MIEKAFDLISLPENDPIDENHLDIPPSRYLTSTDETNKPNYYLSIPIIDPKLIETYINYRDHLLSTHPTVFTSRTNASDPPPHLHVTLLTLRMETSTQVEQCQIALKRFQEEIRYHCSYPEPISLEFQGIGIFHEKVLYIKCRSNPRLENLRTLIIERFREQQQQKQNLNEIVFAGNYSDYLPHITLLKCKRKCSSLEQYGNHEIIWGKQTIDSLELRPIGSNTNDEQNDNGVFKLDLS